MENEAYRKRLNDLKTSRALYTNQLDKEWMDRRMKAAQANRTLQQLKIEEEAKKQDEHRALHSACLLAKVAQEEGLAKEIELMKREKKLEEAKRQQIRQNNPELRELEVKLRTAYVNQDLVQQIRENEYKKVLELRDRRHDHEVLLNAAYDEQHFQRMSEDSEDKKKMAYGKELREQMVETAMQKQYNNEEIKTERVKLDELSKILRDENLRKAEIKKLKQEEIRNEMEIFQIAKKASKEKERQLALKEEQMLAEYQKQKNDNAIDDRKRRLDKFNKHNARICSIANRISDEKAVKEERENLITTLYEKECLDLQIQKERQEQVLFEQNRKETKIALLKQMAEHDAKLKYDKEADHRFQIELQHESDLQTKKNVENEKTRREKNFEHGNEIKRQIVLNKEKRIREKEDEVKRNAGVMEHHAQILNDVVTERKSMIKEFAPKALGYLQPGLLTNEDLLIVQDGRANDPTLMNSDIEAMRNRVTNPNKSKCNPQCLRIKKH